MRVVNEKDFFDAAAKGTAPSPVGDPSRKKKIIGGVALLVLVLGGLWYLYGAGSLGPNDQNSTVTSTVNRRPRLASPDFSHRSPTSDENTQIEGGAREPSANASGQPIGETRDRNRAPGPASGPQNNR
jgi:hypothetical protein